MCCDDTAALFTIVINLFFFITPACSLLPSQHSADIGAIIILDRAVLPVIVDADNNAVVVARRRAITSTFSHQLSQCTCAGAGAEGVSSC